MIHAVGPPDAELVACGRDPGFHELQAGMPFVGPAGKLLDRALIQAGIPRATMLITNVVPVRPAGDKWSAHSASEIETGVQCLHALLGKYDRQLIVAMGEHALLACLGHDPRQPLESVLPDSISNVRGYVFEGPFGPVLAMVHPAFILRTWHPWWATFCWDWKKAARLAESGYRAPERTQAWASNGAIVDAWLAGLRGDLTPIAVDIEQNETGKIETKKGHRTEKSLRFLASLLTDEPFWKNYDFQSEEEKFLLCAKDARLTKEIFDKLQARFA